MSASVRRITEAILSLTVILAAAPAGAQTTREQSLAAERAEKATQLRPYEPTVLERRLQRLESLFVSERAVYTFIGGTYEGGGFALGPGFRGRIGETGSFDAHAGWSIRNYKAATATATMPSFAAGRVRVAMSAEWLDAPSVASYGVGNDTSVDARTSFALRSTTLGVSTRIQPVRFVAIGGGMDAMNLEATPDGNPNYRRSHAFAEFDWRSSPGYTRSGGQYRIDWSDYRASAGQSSFRRVDAEVKQFIPLMRENWVIAFRALASSTETTDGNEVPLVLLPALGGGDSLRGYPAWRFRDRNRLLLTGEYRWTAGPFVDMALFMDAGKVAARFEDLGLKDMQTSYGIGMTLHTLRATLTRVELARTREGMGVSFSFGANF
jgi:hypothetical protein